MNTKICSKCNIEKPESTEFFEFRSDTKKFRNQCKECKKEYDSIYTNLNSVKRNENRKKYYKNNKIKEQERNKIYYENNKEKIIYKINEYVNKKRNTDYSFRLRSIVSSSIYKALKHNKSSKNKKSIITYLEYTIEGLIQHIEKQFESWMSWENWGKYNPKTWNDNDHTTWTWQLDHIIPHSTFHYTSMDDEEFKKCWALKNLRPLSAKQNFLDGTTKIRHRKS